MRRWLPLGLVVLLAACPTPKQYRNVRPGLSCERATRVAHRTLVTMGFTITELVPARVDHKGVVTGVKRAPDGSTSAGRAVIHCDAQGATVVPVEDSPFPTFDFSRGFVYSFTTLVQRPDVEEPRAAAGLEVLVQALTPSQAMLDIGSMPTTPAAVAMRITVRNNTERTVAVDPARLDLMPAGGDAVRPLGGAALEAVLVPGPGADRVRQERFTARRVPPHTTVSGYLVYPAATYREASIAVEDVETGESEGFVSPVQ